MGKARIPVLSIVLVVLLFTAFSCKKEDPGAAPELLVMCGITMKDPAREIADYIEKTEKCRITLLIDGSKNLLDIIEVNRAGDLFLPGTRECMDSAVDSGYIKEYRNVGYNVPVLVVAKGNPLGLDNELSGLTEPSVRVIVGSPESGAIGMITKNILERSGIYNEVVSNSVFLSTDSKDIVRAIAENEADAGINWRATAVWDENRMIMDYMELPDSQSSPVEVNLGLLEYSKYPGIAEKYMDFAVSVEGRRIFKKYGF